VFVAAEGANLIHFATLLSGSRATAEDLVQAALTATFPHWKKVRGGQPHAYVRRAIVNANTTRWRSRARTLTVPVVPDRPGPDAYTGVDDRDALLRGLAMLTEAQRTVVLLRDLEQWDYPDIADLLHVPESTVRSHRARGLAALRRLLDHHHDDGAASVVAHHRPHHQTTGGTP